MHDEEILVNKAILMELVYWARRYCDGRSTYAPHNFNRMYKYIRTKHPDVVRCLDKHDSTLMDDGAYWPFAQDGMYNKETGKWDANK